MPVKTLNPTYLFPRNAAVELAHDVAVELAISVADLPKGTAIILQSASLGTKTDILVKEPTDTEYALLAHVSGAEVTFADDPAANITEVGA